MGDTTSEKITPFPESMECRSTNSGQNCATRSLIGARRCFFFLGDGVMGHFHTQSLHVNVPQSCVPDLAHPSSQSDVLASSSHRCLD